MVPTFDGNTLENESFSSGGHSDPCGAGPQILRKSCEVKIQASQKLTRTSKRRGPCSSEAEKRKAAAEQPAIAGSEDILRISHRKGQRPGQRSSGGTSVGMFLEAGEALKVTQTEHGLFISFDRSVVEEYRFGEKREISIGPVTADRVSGWEGSTYVIETLDNEGAKLAETYRLYADGRSLRRTIAIIHRDIEQLAIEQNFDRE